MIVADKRYVDKEKELYPDMVVFAEKRQSFIAKCTVYSSYLNWNALQKECNDIAELFKNRYPDNCNFYNVSKIGDDMYVVEETDREQHTYYYPYVSDKTVVKGSCCYLDYDSAVLATIAMKYMNTKNTDKVADMVMILEKLIDKPMVNIQ